MCQRERIENYNDGTVVILEIKGKYAFNGIFLLREGDLVTSFSSIMESICTLDDCRVNRLLLSTSLSSSPELDS